MTADIAVRISPRLPSGAGSSRDRSSPNRLSPGGWSAAPSPCRDRSATSPIGGRKTRFALRMALALPWLLTALLLLGIGRVVAFEPAGAAAPSAETAAPPPGPAPAPHDVVAKPAAACGGNNLVASLRADGKLAGVEAVAAKVENGEGKLWRIEKPGVAPSFLYGTMHLTDPRVTRLAPAAEAAFDGAKRLVIETTDVIDPKKAAAAFLANPDLINLPRGQTLDDLLDPKDEAAVKAALGEKGIPFAAIRTLQPWFSSMSLMLPACEMARKQDGTAVLDVALANRAAAADKPVEGLETAAEQLESLAGLDMKLQVDSLIATLKLRDRVPDVLETMLALYVDGKIAMIMPTIEAALPEGGVLVGQGEGYDQFEKTVVTDRNTRMAVRLQPMLDKGGAFVAVGALHLPGKDGLVEKLRAGGWILTRAD